jgi:hypothetical protein
MILTKPHLSLIVVLLGITLLLLPDVCSGQYRPSLFFREDWKETPPEIPVTQQHVANPGLKLGLYGAAIDSMRKSNHDHPVDDPFYVWSGQCTGNWALTLKNPGSYVDLSEFAIIRWRAKQSGFRCLHIILKLEDGSWLVSDLSDCSSSDWKIVEFVVADIQWYSLDMGTITEKAPVQNPDLSRVDEIGITDLMAGGSSSACSRLDWIEVYGKAAAR